MQKKKITISILSIAILTVCGWGVYKTTMLYQKIQHIKVQLFTVPPAPVVEHYI